MQKLLLIALALLLFLPNLIHRDINPVLAWDKKEKFDPQLAYLNSIDKLERHVDSIAATQQVPVHSERYGEIMENVVEKRFYHGFSHFSLNENWIAALGGRFIEDGLACTVKPEDIIKYPYAACSQQSIVMMSLLRKKNISYRKIGFPHHYALELQFNKNWYFFDPNMEPAITSQERLLTSWQHQNDQLKKFYDPFRNQELDYQFGIGQIASTGPVNEIPARNARVFQSVTYLLSKIGWLLPLLLILYNPRFSFRPFFWVNLKRRNTSPPSLAI